MCSHIRITTESSKRFTIFIFLSFKTQLQAPSSFHLDPTKAQSWICSTSLYFGEGCFIKSEKAMAPHSSTLAWKIPWMEEPGRLQSMGSLRVGWLSDFTFTFHFHALEKEMATHSSVLAWRIPGLAEPGGRPSMGSHRVGYNWSDLAAAAAAALLSCKSEWLSLGSLNSSLNWISGFPL